MPASYEIDDTAEPVSYAELQPLALAVLASHRRIIAAQPKVRIVRGGHRGELARITGAGMAGGFTVTTECGVALALAERDFVRLGA